MKFRVGQGQDTGTRTPGTRTGRTGNTRHITASNSNHSEALYLVYYHTGANTFLSLYLDSIGMPLI